MTPPAPEPDSNAAADAAVQRYRPAQAPSAPRVPEIGGRKDGTEPTRFGDWEKDGRCIDF